MKHSAMTHLNGGNMVGRAARIGMLLHAVGLVASCGQFGQESSPDRLTRAEIDATSAENATQSSFFDLFDNDDDPNVTIEVNKYIWNASLDILNFMPIERVDPFSGVIVMGYGTPPGGRTPYRATVFVRDPALEARSLDVALATRGGPASIEATRAVEDAILTRARQLRIRDLNL